MGIIIAKIELAKFIGSQLFDHVSCFIINTFNPCLRYWLFVLIKYHTINIFGCCFLKQLFEVMEKECWDMRKTDMCSHGKQQKADKDERSSDRERNQIKEAEGKRKGVKKSRKVSEEISYRILIVANKIDQTCGVLL